MYEKMYPELVFSNEYYTFAVQKKEGNIFLYQYLIS